MDILFMSIFGKRKIVLGKWIFRIFRFGDCNIIVKTRFVKV